MAGNTLRMAYILSIIAVCFITSTVLLSWYLPQIRTMMSVPGSGDPQPVIVVGGGLAGLSAAIEASRHGAKVTIIEKEKNLGGNSAKATSGINGVGTEAQKAKDISDGLDTFIKDTIASGDGLSDPALVEVLAKQSAGAHVWLKSFGLNLTDVVQLGGHSAKRTHRFPPTPEGKAIPVGFTILSTLKKYIESELKDSVRPVTNAVFKNILMKDGKAVGVKYTDQAGNEQEVFGNVVLSAGGYANDHTETSLLEKYTPALAKLPTTNGGWATGDIIKATEDLGLSLVHMDKVQVHPTGFIEPSQPNHHTKFLAPEALRGCGAILLDANGKRFVNELGRRDYVTENIFKQCKPYQEDESNPVVAAMLLTQDVIDKFSPPAVGFYRFKQLIQDFGTLEAVADKMGISVDVLKETVRSYKADAEKGVDQFGKKAFPTVFSENDHFFLGYITPTLHYCMGGIQINPQANVLKASGLGGQSIPGLYAAGEVSGGVHGNNRLGGNSLLECVVFGRIAGQNAAHKAV